MQDHSTDITRLERELEHLQWEFNETLQTIKEEVRCYMRQTDRAIDELRAKLSNREEQE